MPFEGEVSESSNKSVDAVVYAADLGEEADEDSVGGAETQHNWSFEGFLANVPCDVFE